MFLRTCIGNPAPTTKGITRPVCSCFLVSFFLFHCPIRADSRFVISVHETYHWLTTAHIQNGGAHRIHMHLQYTHVKALPKLVHERDGTWCWVFGCRAPGFAGFLSCLRRRADNLYTCLQVRHPGAGGLAIWGVYTEGTTNSWLARISCRTAIGFVQQGYKPEHRGVTQGFSHACFGCRTLLVYWIGSWTFSCYCYKTPS